MALVEELETCARWSTAADGPDQPAGSCPLLTMAVVAVSGWLMALQLRVATRQLAMARNDTFLSAKLAGTRYYLDIILSEAMGRSTAARSGTAALYAFEDDVLSA